MQARKQSMQHIFTTLIRSRT